MPCRRCHGRHCQHMVEVHPAGVPKPSLKGRFEECKFCIVHVPWTWSVHSLLECHHDVINMAAQLP